MLDGYWSPFHCPGCSLLHAVLLNTNFPGGLLVKNPPANVGDAGSVSGLGRSSRKGNDD